MFHVDLPIDTQISEVTWELSRNNC